MAALLPATCAELLQHPGIAEQAAALGRKPAELLLRYNVQRGVACLAAPEISSAGGLDAAFAFQLTYPQKVALDTLDAGRRLHAPPGATFLDE
jgi:diketogulonate reductase-like aldo/keto reductase